MSQKFKLVEDQEDDSPASSIKRHLKLASLLIVLPIIAIVVLAIFSISAEMRRSAVRDYNQQIALMTQRAMPTSTPRPTPVPPIVRRDTSLRTGPALRFDAIRTLKAGEVVRPVGIDITGNWLMLDNGFWVAATVVYGESTNLPIEPR